VRLFLAFILFVALCSVVPNMSIYALFASLAVALAIGVTIVGIWSGSHADKPKRSRLQTPVRDSPRSTRAVPTVEHGYPRAAHAVRSAVTPVADQQPTADVAGKEVRVTSGHRRYIAQRFADAIKAELAGRVLAALESGDHYGLITHPSLLEEIKGLGANPLVMGTASSVAIRTLRGWVFINGSTGTTVLRHPQTSRSTRRWGSW
jgi:predicted amino acid dehydrogenase